MQFKESENPLPGILIGVLLPSIVLLKLSSPDRLGAMGAFWVALALPLCLSFYEFKKSGRISWIPALGLVQVLATGAIGLLKADPLWIAIKEALLPSVLGVAVWLSSTGQNPMLQNLFLNGDILKLDEINQRLNDLGLSDALKSAVRNAHRRVSFAFLLSAILNFGLARYLVQSPVGSEMFNQELGKMTALSFPVIAVPSMIVMTWSYYAFLKELSKILGTPIKELLNSD